MMHRFVAAAFAVAALSAAAQSVPSADFSDMWWNPNESGWGVSLVQHPSNRVYAIWFTYDPREAEGATPGTADYRPLWIVMNGGTWTSPTTLTGNAFVTYGTPFFQPWSAGNLRLTQVGTFTFNFSSGSSGTFTYDISPPAGLAPGDPAYGLPALSGTKPIQRQSF